MAQLRRWVCAERDRNVFFPRQDELLLGGDMKQNYTH